MFVLDGKPLSPDQSFTHAGIQYPSNWLRLATPEERAAIGITETPDPSPYDQRFFWGYAVDGTLIPKDHAQLLEQWTSATRATSNALLAPTDWVVIREADNGSPADPSLKLWRESVRTSCGEKVLALTATTSTSELAAYVTGPEYGTWPAQAVNAEPETT